MAHCPHLEPGGLEPLQEREGAWIRAAGRERILRTRERGRSTCASRAAPSVAASTAIRTCSASGYMRGRDGLRGARRIGLPRSACAAAFSRMRARRRACE